MRGRLGEVQEQRLISLPARGVAPNREGSEGDAVIRQVAADDLPALGSSRAHMVQPSKPQGGLDRLRAAAGEARARQPFRQPALREPLNEPRLCLSRERGHDVGELLEGARGDLRYLSASVADVDDDGTARGIEDAPAVRRDEIRALSALHGERRGRRPGTRDARREASVSMAIAPQDTAAGVARPVA